MLIAHLSDLHVTAPGKLVEGRVDTRAALATALARVQALAPAPDAVVVTGDLVDDPTPQAYEDLRHQLAMLRVPVFVIPGNHDDREAMRAGLRGDGAYAYLPPERFLHYAVEGPFPVRILGLDTVAPGQGAGALCVERLDWLERQLSESPCSPTMLLMHHPPFVTGMAGMDALGLRGRESLVQLLARHEQVVLVLAGHVHRCIHAMVGGRRVCTAPSTAHQLALDLRPDSEPTFTLEPPGLMLHRWDGDALISYQLHAQSYPGPFAFGA